MLRRLLTKNQYLVRGSRELFKKTGGTNITGGVFPYKIGGVDDYLPNQINIQVFGEDQKDKFTTLYGSLLDAIEKKNQKWLKQNIEPQLVDPLLSRDDLHQINKQSPIQLIYNSMSIGIGVNFARTAKEYQVMVEKQNISLYIQNQQNPAEMMKYMATGLPVLLSYHLGIRSARKLVVKGSESNNKQVHLITLEQQSSVQLQKMMGLMGNMSENNMEAFRKIILGSQKPFHVGNIDDFLKKRA